ncbi:glycosyltransferase family 2 protein [Rhodococcus sp. NPDC059969]|uniref:glycosyltransferase family 2 protein n=1 Tax=Rhodococcus sp. NPDC059969 TaxID=3347018 RepID=UPI003672781F
MKDLSGVMVAILTYRRESALAHCIDSVRASIVAAGVAAEIVVGDNDPDSTTPTYVVDGIERLHLGFGGVSAARRALVDLANARERRYIVFVDDDEYVEVDWLSNLLTCAAVFDAGAVAGPVIPVGLPTSELPLHARVRHTTGTPVASAGAGNLLLDLKALNGLNFSDDWDLPGGEDTEFTLRMCAGGVRLLWCDEAIAYEPVDADRRRDSWLFARYVNNGRILALCQGQLTAPHLAVQIVKRAALVLAAAVAIPVAVFSPRVKRVILDHGARNIGWFSQQFDHRGSRLPRAQRLEVAR